MRKIRNLCIILGDQLNNDSLIWQHFDPDQDIAWMAEVYEESTQPISSKIRTVLFLAAMRHFAKQLEKQDVTVCYLNISLQLKSFAEALQKTLTEFQPQAVYCVLPGDCRIKQQIGDFCQTQSLKLQWLDDQHFFSTPEEFTHWLASKKQSRMEYWYRYLRKTRNILVDSKQQPLEGKWNFDKDNRKSFSKQGPPPTDSPITFHQDSIVKSVISDINQYLPDLPGQLTHFNWPINRKQARQALNDFIENRLPFFGDYQDAMWTNQAWLYHSLLSSSLNLKLLNPREVITLAETAYHQGKAPINAVEGFIRQILGWREYIRGLYWANANKWLNFNFFHTEKPLPDFYWTGKTNMTCLQESINQVLNQGYGHHIQRLMVTGLFALIWGSKPIAVHQWYLAMYVDAVAWVEIPNTIGMSQFADGGIVGSKPYIASGAYIDRMSNYCRHCPYNPKQAQGDTACPFTTLYWHFVNQHKAWLAKHPRLAMQVKNWENKPKAIQKQIILRAKWLNKNIDQV
ncbi:cryptochrome/photolyase family protein [Spartinivicinus poritis]|uniref:Cryptochrome/photolyase family protein n=1 Tax=Spartinivicinus poritis TaxID=2994640 RepID=A0ABT5UHJ1_9GAMM|nr:cryptochrome/photolyase family protein [Spartinivicinus sp. A2-2]MDE1465782.1 cryptochrome/photolyase family protein [Spartinivicinus sp. A2-2]